MQEPNQAAFIPWRFYLVLILIGIAVLGLMIRLIELAIFKQDFLLGQGNERVLRQINLPSLRGMIVDRNGYPLAVSTRVYSVWINPLNFQPTQKDLSSLAMILKLPADNIAKLAERQRLKKREFTYLKRGVSPQVASSVKKANIRGIYIQEGYRRFYPEGEIAAQVIGFTNVDDNGQEGLELAYNSWLTGTPEKKWVIKDRLGRIISDVDILQEQKPGNNLVLSLDRRIQYLAYKTLVAGILQNKASSGSAIVLDVKTGEILAMANYPSYNPNNRPTTISSNLRNRAVTDTFEPGSTIKAFSIASALDSGHYKPHSIIDTSPGWMVVEKNVVRDEKDNGLLTVTQILQISSNVGVTKMILGLPPHQLWSLLHRVGFGEITGIGFPGEESGTLVNRAVWGSFTLATLAFGYGLSVTPLQLAKAYAVLANHGVKVPVSLLRLNKIPSGERVIDQDVAEQMLVLLEAVVAKGGSGQQARITGYRMAGKTGTSKLVGNQGYQEHRYFSSFVGIAPLDNPRLVVAVVVHDPQGKYYYGGQVAGPIFKDIMQQTLRILDISPDEMAA